MLFHGNNGYTNEPHCYVIRALPVGLKYWVVVSLLPKY